MTNPRRGIDRGRKNKYARVVDTEKKFLEGTSMLYQENISFDIFVKKVFFI